ncbi:hypothetical protein CHARACLAT_015608 [Characodon lateralis]|uniref:Uncharacterized protein n=1 Tax=Characodon lateralis TaxID=208331 RepID=A0ABU7DHC0_9TELE|nr:hypothetical protein [Characodon lateralis]
MDQQLVNQNQQNVGKEINRNHSKKVSEHHFSNLLLRMLNSSLSGSQLSYTVCRCEAKRRKERGIHTEKRRSVIPVWCNRLYFNEVQSVNAWWSHTLRRSLAVCDIEEPITREQLH